MSQPGPDERLAAVLAQLPPDFCRSLLAALDRAAHQGGGEVPVTLRVHPDGRMSGCLVVWYERRIGAGGAT